MHVCVCVCVCVCVRRVIITQVWEVASGYCVKTLSGHTQWVRHVAIGPTGSLYASCSDEQVRARVRTCVCVCLCVCVCVCV